MKFIKPLFITALACAVFAPATQAASYCETDLEGVSGFQYIEKYDPYTHTFNLSGFDPLKETICWAELKIAFADDPKWFYGYPYTTDNPSWGDGEEWVTVKLDGTSVASWEVDGSHLLGYDWRSITGDDLIAALSDGSLDLKVKISNRDGDTYVKEVILKAVTCARNVPDSGSTIALLGLGLLGLSVLKRRK